MDFNFMNLVSSGSGSGRGGRRKTVSFIESNDQVRTFHESEIVARVHVLPTQRPSSSSQLLLAGKQIHHMISFFDLPRNRRSKSGDVSVEEMSIPVGKKQAMVGVIRIRQGAKEPSGFSVEYSFDGFTTSSPASPIEKLIATKKRRGSSPEPPNQLMALEGEEYTPSVDSPKMKRSHWSPTVYEFTIDINGPFLEKVISRLEDVLGRTAPGYTSKPPCVLYNMDMHFRIPEAEIEFKCVCQVARIMVSGDPNEKTLISMMDDSLKLNGDVQISPTSSGSNSRQDSMEQLAMDTDESLELEDSKPRSVMNNIAEIFAEAMKQQQERQAIAASANSKLSLDKPAMAHIVSPSSSGSIAKATPQQQPSPQKESPSGMKRNLSDEQATIPSDYQTSMFSSGLYTSSTSYSSKWSS